MERLRQLDVKFLKGIGPARAKLLAEELDIYNVYDLIHHFPTHYIDRSRFYRISEFSSSSAMVQVRGRFVNLTVQGEGAKRRLMGLFTDGHTNMDVVWFQRIKAIRESIITGHEYVLFGKPTEFSGRWSMVHPEIDTAATADSTKGLRGIYPLTDKLRRRGITSRTLFTWITTALNRYISSITDPIPHDIISRNKFMSLRDAITAVHNPTDTTSMQKARERLKFDELFFLQVSILRFARHRSSMLQGHNFANIGKYFNDFYNLCLPFPLTGAQKRVIKEIRRDMNTGRQMNRLLQGDVGSGKTLVALMSMLIAIDNGAQACLMAPTEILATQHFQSISELVAKIGINVKLLTGSTPKAQRDIIASQLSDGSLHILIGTHAVIEDTVQFKELGFVVIDEQHRFGVAQRAKLWGKNRIPPHILVMTATPIPRTLAMTLYGDLEVSVIDELPPGRKPVTTLLKYEEARLDVYRSVTRQIRMGRQVYIVYPLIKENEKTDLKSLEEGYDQICETFRGFRVAYVHGQMKPAEKEVQMRRFASHEADILVATTVIEVGVNVPNATIMIIENAERFGLSQLHQLRGRVGRGEGQSYCILMTKPQISAPTRKRLGIMTATSDGFKVAEADLKLRGPGDLEGTIQSGMGIDLQIANLATDGVIISLARNEASALLDTDPRLANPTHQPLAREILALFHRKYDWGMIS